MTLKTEWIEGENNTLEYLLSLASDLQKSKIGLFHKSRTLSDINSRGIKPNCNQLFVFPVSANAIVVVYRRD